MNQKAKLSLVQLGIYCAIAAFVGGFATTFVVDAFDSIKAQALRPLIAHTLPKGSAI